MSDDVTRLLERADAIEAEALAGKWLVGRTTHAPHYDDCLTCEPVRIAAALAARLRDAEAENARLREVIDNAAISWLALEPGVEWEGDLAAAMSAACGEIVRLRSANARLREACSKQNDDVCQVLGKALGYPWYKDDQTNFPGADESNGVCVGDHAAESIADEAAKTIARLREDAARQCEAIRERVHQLPKLWYRPPTNPDAAATLVIAADYVFEAINAARASEARDA